MNHARKNGTRLLVSVRCYCDDAKEQVKCEGYEDSGDEWCRFSFDQYGNITDECMCPRILEEE